MNLTVNDSIPGWNDIFSLNVLGGLVQEVPANGWVLEVNSYCGRASYVLGKNKKESVLLTCTEEFPDCPQEVPEGAYGNTSRHYNKFTFNITMRGIPNTESFTARVPFFSKNSQFIKPLNLVYFNAPYNLDVTREQLESLDNLIVPGTKIAFNANNDLINSIRAICRPEKYAVSKDYNILVATRR